MQSKHKTVGQMMDRLRNSSIDKENLEFVEQLYSWGEMTWDLNREEARNVDFMNLAWHTPFEGLTLEDGYIRIPDGYMRLPDTGHHIPCVMDNNKVLEVIHELKDTTDDTTHNEH